MTTRVSNSSSSSTPADLRRRQQDVNTGRRDRNTGIVYNGSRRLR